MSSFVPLALNLPMKSHLRSLKVPSIRYHCS